MIAQITQTQFETIRLGIMDQDPVEQIAAKVQVQISVIKLFKMAFSGYVVPEIEEIVAPCRKEMELALMSEIIIHLRQNESAPHSTKQLAEQYSVTEELVRNAMLAHLRIKKESKKLARKSNRNKRRNVAK